MRTTLPSLLLVSLSLSACTGSDPIEASASGTSDGSTTDGSSTATTTMATTMSSTGTDTNSTGTDSDTATTTTTTTTTTSETGTSSTTTSTTEPVTTTDSTTTLTTEPTTGTTDPTTGTTEPTTGTTDATTGTTGVDDPCPCADVEVPLNDGIFVLSDNAELWKYKPMDNAFEMLGALGCQGMTNTFSMAVDRLGFAWVMFDPPTGQIRKVDVTNPALCTDPGYFPGQMGVNRFGMAFVSQDQFNTCDQLYGNTFNGLGGFSEGPNFGQFLTVDPMNLQVQILGNTTFNGAEVTGSGDGRAFLFGGVNPAKLVEVDKANGQYLDVLPLGNLSLTNAFAFAFFAGDFYMFTESAGFGSKSKVTQLDYDDSDNNGIQDLTIVNMNAPIRIVGAGVSTCAPYAPQ